MAVALLAAGLLAALPSATAAQEPGPVYVVEPGDTLWGLAAEFGTTVEALSAANGLSGGGISPGQQLVIPGFEGLSGRLATHDVAFGENLRTVAQTYGVEADDLLRLNRGIAPERLYVGQPMIVTLGEGNPLALAEANRILPSAHATLIETALLHGRNPWSLQLLNDAPERLWLLPRDTLALPAPGTPHRAFPLPILSTDVLPEAGVQGHTLTFRLAADQPLEVAGALGDWPLTFNLGADGTLVALQGVHALAEPGLYDLSLQLQTPGDELAWFSYVQPIRIRPGDYGRETLTVDPDTLDPEVTGPEDVQVQSLVTPNTPTKYWDGSFAFPSSFYTDAFPSTFGTRRNYNGEGYFRYHNGLDFYGGTGVPVLAAAPGRVVFAGPMTVRGNVTYIDHGWGVYTGYLHQSEILVEPGQLVQTGDPIGAVGATGRVTGPHLHWEVWVGGIPVDPLDWVQQGFPAQEPLGAETG